MAARQPAVVDRFIGQAAFIEKRHARQALLLEPTSVICLQVETVLLSLITLIAISGNHTIQQLLVHTDGHESA